MEATMTPTASWSALKKKKPNLKHRLLPNQGTTHRATPPMWRQLPIPARTVGYITWETESRTAHPIQIDPGALLSHRTILHEVALPRRSLQAEVQEVREVRGPAVRLAPAEGEVDEEASCIHRTDRLAPFGFNGIPSIRPKRN